MKMIAEIVEDIREELEGAEHYAKKATQYKEQARRHLCRSRKPGTIPR